MIGAALLDLFTRHHRPSDSERMWDLRLTTDRLLRLLRWPAPLAEDDL